MYTVDGKKLRVLRKQRRLPQHSLEHYAGLGPNLVGELERNGGNPTINTLWSIADVLGVSPIELVRQTGSKRT